MPQTFYIDSDEEIISVIGRLRKTGSDKNYFVFPKRALVLQSIINLRLFQREAEKLGKSIVIITQDETGRALAQKVGIETENYSDDFSARGAHVELVSQNTPPVSGGAPQADTVPRAESLGSSDFHAPKASKPEVVDMSGIQSGVKMDRAQSAPRAPEGRGLRIRNASPERPPGLNSVRYEEERIARLAPQALQPVPSLMRDTLPSSSSYREPSVPPREKERSLLSSEPQAAISSSSAFSALTARGERLRNFFTGNPGQSTPQSYGQETSRIMAPAQATPPIPPRAPKAAKVPLAGDKGRLIFMLLGGVSLISLIGVGIFLFLPKAEVFITPHQTSQNVDLQFDGRSGAASGDNVIRVRLVEKEKPLTVTVTATGSTGGSNQKARGTVAISNRFSADSQSLVATTRFESPDGKVFRLVEGVTVPGMKGETPGTIEAAVIADQTGDAYNIGPAKFTIPGFKSGPKFEKFTAESNKAMSGGGSGGGSISVIAKADLEKADQEAKEKAKEAYLNEVKQSLLPEEKILDQALEITPVGLATLPQVGTAAESFDYQGTFKVRAFVFAEPAVKEMIEAKSKTEVEGVRFTPATMALDYAESMPNFADETVRFKVRAKLVMESVIEEEKLKEALLGQDEDGIRKVLDSFPGVKKIEVKFSPDWLISTIPSSESRVSIVLEPSEE